MQTHSEIIGLPSTPQTQDEIEVHSIILLDSVYENHTLLVTRDVLGQAIAAKTTPNNRVASIMEFGPPIPVQDRRNHDMRAFQRPESYSHLGTLRRGGFSVL